MLKVHVLPVLQDMYGHPEYPRLWAEHIHTTLVSLNFKSCPHELCLHAGDFQGNAIFFKRKLDDFAIATPNQKLTDSFLDVLDRYLKQKLKRQ